MAGGMSNRGGWGPMADRVRQGAEPTSEAPPLSPLPTSVKHCWVTDYRGRLPGLLLEWRQVAGGVYEGRVVRLVDDGEGWIVVEEWLSATMLEKA